MRRPPRWVLVAAQLVFAAAVLWFAGRELRGQWNDVQRSGPILSVRWPVVIGAGGLVLAGYAVLIATWLATLRSWRARLPVGEAVRIWFVSNLGKYIPGKVWQITAMGAMVARLGVSPLVAGSSSILINLVNVVVGFALVFSLASGVLAAYASAQVERLAIVLTAAAVLGLLALPVLLPRLVALLGAATGRQLVAPALPMRAIVVSAVGSAAAWVLYGVAFRWFAEGVVTHATGAVPAYVAVFTGSYLLGYLALIVPGGFGVREAALAAAMSRMGLAPAPEALVIAVASRLWLTVLEVVPGILFLALDFRRRGSTR